MDSQRLIAQKPDTIDHQRDTRDMVEMRMRHKDMIDHEHFRQTQVADAGARINQYIVVEQHGSRPQITADPAATT
jgi:hypothetical protein